MADRWSRPPPTSPPTSQAGAADGYQCGRLGLPPAWLRAWPNSCALSNDQPCSESPP
jgi:hypothetical protein